MTRVLIIAPHVDDEMIGCYSVITNPDNRVSVVYLHELTMERLAEATQASSRFNFSAFPNASVLTVPKFFEGFDEVYIPSRRDWHPDHRQTNADYRKHATHFYSVDMPQGTFLGDEKAQAKREALDWCYPSQKNLWETNAKYYLFEQIERYDFDRYVQIGVKDRYNARHVGVRVLSKYEVLVDGYLSSFALNERWNEERMFNGVLELCPEGKVSMINHEGYVWESE